MSRTSLTTISKKGRFGRFGGQYVPETLMPALAELEEAFEACLTDAQFQSDLQALLQTYVGRPTPLYHARELSKQFGGAQVLLKREDLNHTGAHKINSAIAQAMLAKRLGKTRIIAETGAGQHGVATATACALLGLSCTIFMGAKDIQRQAPNVFRMKLLGAEVRSVETGEQTLKEATSEAIREWVGSVHNTHFILGTASGPHPYPVMVREFQSIIGIEARRQCLEHHGKLPSFVLACVGGGSNAIGIFHSFVGDADVKLVGLEAGGKGLAVGDHAAALTRGRPGVLHGTLSYLLQDEFGRISDVHSISAGLDYPGVGPEHAFLKDSGRAEYHAINDDEALNALRLLARTEGIICALETAHALAYLAKLAPQLSTEQFILVNLSGRGDKDLSIIQANVEL